MKKKIVETTQAPKPVGPYSQAVQVGHLLFCSGQVSIDPSDNQVKMTDIQTQTRLVMENIKAVLTAAGGGFQNVVKTTIFLKRMSDFAVVNEIYGSYFLSEPPARSTVEVSGLPKGLDVEIECVAALS